MRVYLFFNVFTTLEGRLGYGHARVSLPDYVQLTEHTLKDVEKQIREAEGYLAVTITSITQIDA